MIDEPAQPPADHPAAFAIDVELHRDSARVAPAGELDIATGGELTREVRALAGNGLVLPFVAVDGQPAAGGSEIAEPR